MEKEALPVKFFFMSPVKIKRQECREVRWTVPTKQASWPVSTEISALEGSTVPMNGSSVCVQTENVYVGPVNCKKMNKHHHTLAKTFSIRIDHKQLFIEIHSASVRRVVRFTNYKWRRNQNASEYPVYRCSFCIGTEASLLNSRKRLRSKSVLAFLEGSINSANFVAGCWVSD